MTTMTTTVLDCCLNERSILARASSDKAHYFLCLCFTNALRRLSATSLCTLQGQFGLRVYSFRDHFSFSRRQEWVLDCVINHYYCITVLSMLYAACASRLATRFLCFVPHATSEVRHVHALTTQQRAEREFTRSI